MTKKKSIYFCAVHLLLLVLLLIWLALQNQPIQIATSSEHITQVQCVSYAPYYQKGQSPLVKGIWIKPQQIEHDLAILSKLSPCVRTYSVGQGLDYVPEAAKKLGMQVYLGAWIGWTDQDNIKEIRLAAKKAEAYPNVVKGLIVGNEVLLRQEQTPQSMQAYLSFARTLTSVPITYADVWEFWLDHQILSDYVDFHTIHILPYWEDDPKHIDEAVKHTENVMATMTHEFDKPILIGETGWPSQGRQRYDAMPSLVNQAKYIHGFMQKAKQHNWQYNIIEAIDQPWKRVQEGTVGGYWGLLASDMTMKYTIGAPVAERSDGWLMLLIAMLNGLLFLGVSAYLGSKTWPILIGAWAIGTITGIVCLLQWDYLLAACTNISEWLAFGGLQMLGGLLSLCLLIHIIANIQLASVAVNKISLVLLYAVTYTSYLIYMDGRYRNFPIVLFVMPAILLTLNKLFAFKPIKIDWFFHGLIAVAAVQLAFLSLSYELDNDVAALWVLVSCCYACACWPSKHTTTWLRLKLFKK